MLGQECPFNPFDPAVIESPYAFFDWLRSNAPVYELPNGAYALVSRYEDVRAATLDPDTFSSNLVAVLQTGDETDAPNLLSFTSESPSATDVLAIADPPLHSKQRQLSNTAFTRRRVEAMSSDINALTQQLIDGWIGQGSVDWVQGLAVPLPMTIIVRLLGLPESDCAQLKRWSDASVQLLSGVNSSTDMRVLNQEIADMFTYLGQQLQAARTRDDNTVMSDLLRGEAFDLNVLTSMMVQLLTAGNETTSSLISSALRLLLQTPGLQQQLRVQPALIEPFVEEVLRLSSPFHGHFRVTTKECELGGVALAKGQRLMLLWGAANRDDKVFTQAQNIRLDRQRPRAHLAFGYGIHQCIGAALARMEAQSAIRCMLQRTTDIRLSTCNNYAHVPSLFIRSLKRLQIDFDAA